MEIRKIFSVSAIVMLLAIGAIAVDNYNQEWRTWQRAYFTALTEQENGGSVSLVDRLNIEMGLNINSYKVVTNPDRDADTCMVCHVNVQNAEWAAENEDFQHAPLKGLLDSHEGLFILNDFSFDQVGCTSCHGGDPIALKSEKAHEFLRDRFDVIFLESLEELSSPKQMVRQHALERIRWMTGNAFGYNFSDPIDERDAAIARAEAWWGIHKDTFAEEGFGEIDSPFKTVNLLAEMIESVPAVSITGDTLEFVGSTTCIGCHASPLPGGAPYIPETHQLHIDEWYQDKFKTSTNPELYLLKHPTLFENLIPTAIPDPERQEELLALIRESQGPDGMMPDPDEISDIVDYMKNFDVTCEACHGPGNLYMQMMSKGLSLEFLGNSAEASSMIGHGAEIAQRNAKLSVANSEIWGVIQCLATGSTAENCTTSPSHDDDNGEHEEPEPPAPDPDPDPDPDPEPEPEHDPEEDHEHEEAEGDDPVVRGQALSQSCMACHTVDGTPRLGPSWLGLYGSTQVLLDGTTVTVDDEYLVTAIIDPNAQVPEGFSPNIMQPHQFSDEQLQDIIAYIKSLTE